MEHDNALIDIQKHSMQQHIMPETDVVKDAFSLIGLALKSIVLEKLFNEGMPIGKRLEELGLPKACIEDFHLHGGLSRLVFQCYGECASTWPQSTFIATTDDEQRWSFIVHSPYASSLLCYDSLHAGDASNDLVQAYEYTSRMLDGCSLLLRKHGDNSTSCYAILLEEGISFWENALNVSLHAANKQAVEVEVLE